ncbi:MAG: phage terminase large subunit family protein [Bauldia sp.]|nr:phage terminase large subunit family protein [Bauldia sp.]
MGSNPTLSANHPATVRDGSGSSLHPAALRTPRRGREGVAGNRPAIKASDTRGSKLFIVDVDDIKGQLSARLARGRSIRFSANLETRFYEELASERLIVRYVRGAPVRRWERIPGRRAECLDVTVYAWAARALLTLGPEPPGSRACCPTGSAWAAGRDTVGVARTMSRAYYLVAESYVSCRGLAICLDGLRRRRLSSRFSMSNSTRHA